MTADEIEPRSLKSRFEAVYRENHWGDDESASGAGSRLDSLCVQATEDALDHAIRNLGVFTIVDAPCGDFNWMRRFLERHPDVGYEGCDIVDDLIRRNRETYPSHRFQVMNLAEAVPPRADLILCKDLLNHLNDRDVCRVLHNFKASGSGYLLLSNNRGCEHEELPFDVGGSSRHLDVTLPPFDFPRPIWETHYLALWGLDQIPDEFVLPARHYVSSAATGRAPENQVAAGAVLMDATPPLQVFCGRGTAGIILFGPYLRAKAGRYRASFRLHRVPSEAAQAAAPCARVEVTTDQGRRVICGRDVAAGDLHRDPCVVLDFEIGTEEVLELRVHSAGRIDMIVDYDRHLVRLEERFLAAGV